ncbi:unnamed protein product, partial [Symbiodinium sp. CCMP2456]
SAWLQALQLLRSAGSASFRPGAVGFTSAIGACSKAEQWESALDTLSTLFCSGGGDRPALNAAMSGHWAKACLLLSPSELLAPNEVSFGAALRSLDTWPRATALLQVMPSRRCFMNEICFGSAISACEDSRGWATGIQLIEAMPVRKLVANEVCFNAAIGACGGAGEIEAAMGLLDALRHRRCAGPTSFATAITACARRGQWQRGFLLLAEMAKDKIQPDEFCYGATMAACERSHQWQWAVQLLATMEDAKVPASQICFNSAISACEKLRKWEIAIHLLASMPQRRLAADAFATNAALSSCGASGRWEEALSLFAAHRSPDTVACNALLTAFETASQWQQALDFMEHLHQGGGIQPDMISYAACIAAVAPRWPHATRLLADLRGALLEVTPALATAVAPLLVAGEQFVQLAEELDDCAGWVRVLRP